MKVNFGDLPEPGDRYQIGSLYGLGVFGKVHSAVDKQASDKKVAIKIQRHEEFVEEEFKILRDCSNHVNVIDFYGVYRHGEDIWFILEPCDGGPVIDLVLGLLAKNRRMTEEHIAYIIKETIRGLIYLHENNVTHRDIKGRNILLTREGEVKLCDFGLSKRTKKPEEKLTTSLGSPCWMAPELVMASSKKKGAIYDNRIDVWAVGITAIELGDGKAPFQDMHPTRALFQIVRNPPPTLTKISQWSGNYHDFISECLVKDSEYRPFIVEVIEHPFLGQIPENNYHLSLEIKSLLKVVGKTDPMKRSAEASVIGRLVKRSTDEDLEPMYDEDLAALKSINENEVLDLLEKRMERGECYSFIGDILLSLNPNEKKNIFGQEFHHKYQLKSRSDNAPHIYAIADTAYQNAIHHSVAQKIVLSGETGSGKTTNYLHLIDHLFHLGENQSINSTRIKNAVNIVHSLIHASTPCNVYSTRAVFKTSVTFGKTGKLSGASFKAHFLEKCRVSSSDINQSNFHIFYYIYDGITSVGIQNNYNLNADRKYHYLRSMEPRKSKQPKDNIDNNAIKYKKLCDYFIGLEFSEEQVDTIHSVLAAILHLGETRFKENDDYVAVIENKESVDNFCDLTGVESKKLSWALTNYCLIKGGNAIRKRNTCEEAKEARDVLANTLYCRLVDYIISIINNKLSFGKAIFGAKFSISILDYFGFECFKSNGFFQFIVNCFNEQLHYHFLQRIFAWETLDLQNEEIEFTPICHYKNKDTLNEMMGKPDGVLSIIDDASKKGLHSTYILDNIYNQEKNKILTYEASNFTVVHYTGRVSYNSREMPEKNRDFLPPEIIETMRGSQNPIVSLFFTNKLDRTGNLMVPPEEVRKYRFNFMPKDNFNKQYSQIKKMRTQATVFRSLCLDLLKELSVGSGSGSTHFIRCVRTDLHGVPGNFQKELVRQQIRAMAVVESAKTRQQGYSQRISFPEFLRRYKFLCFDFEENVDITGDNCRLLLIRLKMEGWALGKTKVFLKYYNEEYLSRLYETQVRKIVKIQSILRGFLAKCKIAKQVKMQEQECIEHIQKRRRSSVMTEEEAAEVIQKAYRKTMRRRRSGMFDFLPEADQKFIRPYTNKWRNHSLFSVLLRYRAIKLQDFFNLSQQVHLYNQNTFHNVRMIEDGVDLNKVDSKASVASWLGDVKISVLKLHFRLDEIPFYDTSHMYDQLTNIGSLGERDESWDTPYRWRDAHARSRDSESDENLENGEALTNMAYSRDPKDPIVALPHLVEEYDDEEDAKQVKESINAAMKGTNSKGTKMQMSPLRFDRTDPPFKNINLRKIEDTYKNKINREYLINSAPANKDFDYIKATPLTVKPKHSVDPISELRNKARRDSNSADDEPPFNFQGMLRKTNFRRDSLKNAVEAVRRFSLPRDDDDKKSKVMTNGTSHDEVILSKPVAVEILPGLFMEGMEVDL